MRSLRRTGIGDTALSVKKQQAIKEGADQEEEANEG